MHYLWRMFERYLLLHELHGERRYYEDMYAHASISQDEVAMSMYERHLKRISKDLEDVYNEW